MADLLPQSILNRPKLGFPTPWSRWLAGPQLDAIQSLLQEPRSLGRELFKPAAISRLLNEHRAGHRDHYERIWRLLNLELWQRVCLEGDSRQTEAGAQRPAFCGADIAHQDWLPMSSSRGDNSPKIGRQCSSALSAVPSDHLVTGTKKRVKRSSTSLTPMTGEPGKPAPQAAGSVSGAKNIRWGCQWPPRSLK